MKKIALVLMVLVGIVSCNKESATTENNLDIVADSVASPQSDEASAAVIPFKVIEFTPDQTSKILAKQNNDTLYVTNFFATWCGPCMREMPHFKEKMQELDAQPVKFTFVGLDAREDWETKVKKFAEENNLSKHIIMVDGEQLFPEFFPANFKEWDGGSIPFTHMRKGDKTDETIGMMSPQMLTDKINSFK